MTRARSRTAPQPVDTGVSSAAGLAFGTPPSSGKGVYDWAAIEERCRANPGEWLQVFEQGKRSTAVAVRQGSVRRLSADNGFEVKTANAKTDVSPPVCDLWVRYVRAKDQHKRKGSKR